MRLEPVSQNDVYEISEIWERCHSRFFSLPSRRNLITEAKAVENDKIIGYGQVRLVAEPILVMDLDERPRYRAIALDLLMDRAVTASRIALMEKLFGFVRDPEFADIIVKKYKFTRADLGEFLIREL